MYGPAYIGPLLSSPGTDLLVNFITGITFATLPHNCTGPTHKKNVIVELLSKCDLGQTLTENNSNEIQKKNTLVCP